jgi:hypothetical protein
MSTEKTFGAWLLEQQQRQDTMGALARAWKQMKEVRGLNRITRAKSIRELMSSSLGEDWLELRGDEAMDAAEAEWKAADEQQLPIPGVMMANYMEQARNVAGEAVFEVPPPAVLVFGEHTYQLTPGRRYTLVLQPVLREAVAGEISAQAGGIELADGYEPNLTVWARPDGGYDWAALYGMADRSAEAPE